MLSGCDEWVEVEDYGNEKFEWLKTFLELENEIPSHDTIGRIFSLLEPESFQDVILAWLTQLKKKRRPTPFGAGNALGVDLNF